MFFLPIFSLLPPRQTLGNSWRIGPDDTNWQGVLTNIDINSELSQYSGPGGELKFLERAYG